MNPLLEQACGWFGAASCESASAAQYAEMLIAAAALVIFVIWAGARLSNR